MWRWLALALVALAVVAYIERAPLLQAIGNFLVVKDPLVRVDAIIAIAGNGPERVATSVRLLHEGYGQWLVISGGPYGYRFNSAITMRDQALDSGVAAERILLDDSAGSTVDNALGSARLMKARGLRTAILVTSPYHTRRAAVVFSRIFRRHGLAVRVRAADESFFQVQRWWTRDQDRGLVVGEYAKLLAFLGGAR